jgi:cytochrome c oxidase subunit 3
MRHPVPARAETSSPFSGDLPQRRSASELGIWLFLATEVLFFGGLITSYAVNRVLYPEAFTIAARHTEVTLGTINTAILLTSSLAVALAVKAERSDPKLCGRLLLLTIALGAGFLGVKAWEYYKDIEEGLVPGPGFPLVPHETQLFWALYWLLTGVHTLHVIAGMSVLSVLYGLKRMNRIVAERSSAIEIGALYWHLVDVIWIFLYPMLYLVGRSS